MGIFFLNLIKYNLKLQKWVITGNKNPRSAAGVFIWLPDFSQGEMPRTKKALSVPLGRQMGKKI